MFPASGVRPDSSVPKMFQALPRFRSVDDSRTHPVILNWPERIKTQPHDDRDNCFQHFDSKGPLRYDSEQ